MDFSKYKFLKYILINYKTIFFDLSFFDYFRSIGKFIPKIINSLLFQINIS